MNKLSVVILTKNVEEFIADCIDSVPFASEIIVIDDMSTDRTAEIAKLHGAKVISHEFASFADRRNFGLKKAKGDWIFYIDADERVSKELEESIKYQVLSIKQSRSAFRIKRKNFYLGNHEWPAIEQMERLFKKKELQEWVGDLHETPKFNGEIGELNGFLFHYTHRDLRSMLDKTIAWSGIEAQLRYDANHPRMTWWRFPRVMVSAFYDSYIKQKGYTVGVVGLIESIFQAFSMFITYARLWELQHVKRSSPK
jgi:glycosyltransferase involved in cell wall biosynthesis